jgi:hypothetical protein
MQKIFVAMQQRAAYRYPGAGGVTSVARADHAARRRLAAASRALAGQKVDPARFLSNAFVNRPANSLHPRARIPVEIPPIAAQH